MMRKEGERFLGADVFIYMCGQGCLSSPVLWLTTMGSPHIVALTTLPLLGGLNNSRESTQHIAQ